MKTTFELDSIIPEDQATLVSILTAITGGKPVAAAPPAKTPKETPKTEAPAADGKEPVSIEMIRAISSEKKDTKRAELKAILTENGCKGMGDLEGQVTKYQAVYEAFKAV